MCAVGLKERTKTVKSLSKTSSSHFVREDLYPQYVPTDTFSGLHLIPNSVVLHSEPGAVSDCQVTREWVQTR